MIAPGADARAAAPDWQAARNVLCVRLDSVGDVLMTTPALRALRESAPGRRITLLTSAGGAAVAPLVPEIDETIVFDAPWMKSTGTRPTQDAAMIERLAARGFDAAVIFTVYSQNPLPAAYLAYLAGIPRRLAHCRENPYALLTDWMAETEPAAQVRHEVRRQLDLVGAVGARTGNERLSLSIPLAVHERVARLLAEHGLGRDAGAPCVLIHPGASAPSRRYPAEGFAQAATLLAAQGCRIALTGSGDDEVALAESIRRAVPAPVVSLAGRLDLAELGAAIAQADLLLVNNTGPAHMAAALGTPLVDLYALTNPQHTPWQASARVLNHDVPCRDCYKSVCPQRHHDCLRQVAPQAVAQAALELLAEARASRAADPGGMSRRAASDGRFLGHVAEPVQMTSPH